MQDLVNQLKEVANRFRAMNNKVKLVALIEKAKQEYDSYDYASCRESLVEAKRLDNKKAVVWRGLGCLEQHDGNFEKALEYFFKALEFSEKKELEYTLIGTVYYIVEDFDEAIKYFELAINNNENYDMAYEGKNQAMLENHVKILDLQEALKKYF